MKLGIAILALLTSSNAMANQIETKAIYGNDDRQDFYQVQDTRLLHLAKSTVALINSSMVKMRPRSPNARLVAPTFAESMELCEDEPFRDQPAAAFCSGSLVGPDLVLTAGHCLRDQDACADTKFVFDFAVESRPNRNQWRRNPTTTVEVPKTSVYSCGQLLGREQQTLGPDWAIVKLDRPVTDRPFLHVRRQGAVAANDGVLVIGYPSGIPVKISGGAKVRTVSPNGFFLTDLDTYSGNSGSPVFNAQTLDIEGILVRGEADFVARGRCNVSNVCNQNDCRGEDVTLVSEVLHMIPPVK